jgi:hypothetical protein
VVYGGLCRTTISQLNMYSIKYYLREAASHEGDSRQRPPHRECIREAVQRGGGTRLEGNQTEATSSQDVSERPLRGGGAMLEGISDRGHLFTGCIREVAQGMGDEARGDNRQRPPIHRMIQRGRSGVGERYWRRNKTEATSSQDDSERPLRGGGARLGGEIKYNRGHLFTQDVSERPFRGRRAMLVGISDRGHLFTGCFREAAQGWGSDVGGEIRQRPPIHRMYQRGHSGGWGGG